MRVEMTFDTDAHVNRSISRVSSRTPHIAEQPSLDSTEAVWQAKAMDNEPLSQFEPNDEFSFFIC